MSDIANAIYTPAQIAAYVSQGIDQLLDFCLQRNPTAVYAFIMQNWPDQYTRFGNGGEVTYPVMADMGDFLKTKYLQLPASAQPEFLKNLLDSLPSQAELQNWTTPGTPDNTSTIKNV